MLLNKFNLNITQFASKEAWGYSLQGIQVTSNETVATNGHLLVRVTTPMADEKNFPDVPGFYPSPKKFKTFILPTNVAQIVAKLIPKSRNIPILEHARVSSNGSSVKIAVADIDNPKTFTPKTLKDKFPNWKSVMPQADKEICHVTLNADYLAELAKVAGKFNDHKAIRLRIFDNGHYKLVSIEAVNDQTGQEFQSIVMPIMD